MGAHVVVKTQAQNVVRIWVPGCPLLSRGGGKEAPGDHDCCKAGWEVLGHHQLGDDPTGQDSGVRAAR